MEGSKLKMVGWALFGMYYNRSGVKLKETYLGYSRFKTCYIYQ